MHQHGSFFVDTATRTMPRPKAPILPSFTLDTDNAFAILT